MRQVAVHDGSGISRPPRSSARALAAEARAGLPWVVLVVPVAFIVLLPIARLELKAFEDGGAAFTRAASLPGIGRVVLTTVWLALGSASIALVLGTGLAWCSTLLPRRLRALTSSLPVLPIVIPAVAAITGWAFLLSPTVGYLNQLLRRLPVFDHLDRGPIDVFSVPWIIILTGISLTALVYLFLQSGLRAIPADLQSAAAVSGAGSGRVFLTVTLPLLRPSLAYAAGVALVLGLGQFTAPLLLGRNQGVEVLSTRIYRLVGQYPIDYGVGAALGSPILLAGLAIVVAQRLAIGDQRRFVVATSKAGAAGDDARWWAAAAIWSYALVAAVLPILALVYVSVSPFWNGQLTLQGLTLDHIRTTLSADQVRSALANSIWASLLAIAILIPVGFLCALAMLKWTGAPRWVQVILDLLVSLPLAVPAAMMGFGMLFAYTRPPLELYGTNYILIVAYVTLMLPYSTRLQTAGLMAIGRESYEASAASGAGPIRTVTRVLLPQTRRSAATAAALTFVLLFHEFSASLMVRSVRTQVMGTVVLDTWTSGIYPQVAALSLLMAAVTFLGVVTALWVGGSDALRRL